jgi:hypothetical protein
LVTAVMVGAVVGGGAMLISGGGMNGGGGGRPQGRQLRRRRNDFRRRRLLDDLLDHLHLDWTLDDLDHLARQAADERPHDEDVKDHDRADADHVPLRIALLLRKVHGHGVVPPWVRFRKNPRF